jgi:chromate reductase, NAD(P)H dehydrogenase (quinone)
MNINIISASSRKNSNTLKFVNFLSSIITGDTITITTFEECDIPNIGRGIINPNELTSFQKEIIGNWEKANIVIFAVPEYNWSTNGEFINALHQLGNKDYGHLFDNKVFGVVGVSAGRGGRTPALEIVTIVNKIINFTNHYSIVSPRIYESHETVANINVDNISSPNEIYFKSVQAFADYTVRIASKFLN